MNTGVRNNRQRNTFRARIATVCQARTFFPSIQENREHVMGLLDLALRQGPDLVCLPEAFSTASVPASTVFEIAEPVPGPTFDAVAEKARASHCYVICPIYTRRDGACWNSAIVIDRAGEIAGIYDKVHPVTSTSDYTLFEDGTTPGSEVPVFDLPGLGRIGIQICFDAGFPESWAELADKGARMVFWPSAYDGGFALQAYAYLHHYYVVSAVRSDRSRIIDPCGAILAETDGNVNVVYRDINLDWVVSHYDFNFSIPDKIMQTYPGRVEVRSYFDSAHFVVEPLDDTLTVEQLQREFGFEPTSRYHQRHREAYQQLRKRCPASPGAPADPQAAAHGDRPMYAKCGTRSG